MSDWEHTDRSSDGGCYWCDGETACATPIPDPTSPCGFERCVADSEHRMWRDPSRFPNDVACLHEERDDCHPHIATRCLTCHHEVTRA